MHGGPEFTAVLFLCVALGLGSLARFFGGWLKLPYTIVVLLVGLAIGYALQTAYVQETAGVLVALDSGASIAPDLIIFVFLPALIFESAFALDTHAFKKELGGILIFAIPALLVSTVLVGGWTLLVSGLGWNWSIISALVFGALISATDPVAVVAILRETRSPKRLGMLIEGESLMNDGTAIVVFSALLAVLVSGTGSQNDIPGEIVGFLWVVGGGVVVGLAIAWAVSAIISRTFNDAIIEISLTIVAAYGAMFVAEGLLHVSGVIAVVATGLYLSGPGHTLISPEVRVFLHRFWGMVTHIANTLIFFIVGLVIAAQQHDATLLDYEIIAAVFAGVVALRFAITFAFRPLVALVAAPLGKREAGVMAWGGLRGAVSLALALMVSQQSALPASLRQQVLVLTTGVVFLTIVINGSTIGWLLRVLKLSTESTAEKASTLGVQASLLGDVETRLYELAKQPDLAMVPWRQVYEELAEQRNTLTQDRQQALEQLAETTEDARCITEWQQACSIERQAYWQAFSAGILSREGARVLNRALDLHSDALAMGDVAPPTTRVPAASPGLTQRLLNRLAGRRILAHWRFEHLAHTYDLARAQMVAAQHVLSRMNHLYEGPEGWHNDVRTTYQSFERLAKERLEDLRSSLPEIAQAIELRLARRIRLNLELSSYQAQKDAGTMDSSAAESHMRNIEKRMKALMHSPRREQLPETADMVCNMPLFRKLDPSALRQLADMTEEVFFSPGDILIREGDDSDCMYVVARGAAHVFKQSRGKEVLLDTLCAGDIVGEMALLTGEPRNATVRAATTITVGRIDQAGFGRIMKETPSLRESIWTAFSHHRFANLVRHDWRFSGLPQEAIEQWWESSEGCGELVAGDVVSTSFSATQQPAAFLFLASGELDISGSERGAPALLGVDEHSVHRVTKAAYVVRIPSAPA